MLASGVAVGAATLSGPTPANAAPAPAPVAEAATPKDAPADGLDSHDAELLAEAQSSGARSVTLIISTEQGEASDVAAAVDKLGGTVAQRYDKVGYVLATVPTAKVVKTAKLPGVSAVDLDETIQLPDPELTGGGAKGVAQGGTLSGPGASTPAANPYMPTDEIGSVQFKRKHPTWDGRGVTIGIMDSGVDLDHPALQRTTTGERKIVDWVTATDPVTEGDGSWRAMVTEVTGPAFSYLNQSWTAPAGTWKVNRFTEAITAGDEAKGDVNRDGDTTDVWGVLYDPTSHDIRVDANQNRDFTDDAVMRPYREKYDVGHFGTDNQATPVVESMPFVVEYREDVDASPLGIGTVDYINIGIPEGLHGSHVAGITAANDMLGNRDFDGQAPGAKIVSARACSWGGGCTAAALTTGMVDLVVNRHVDVVNVSIGGLPAQNDGNNARAQLYDKLIKDYGVQLFISAGNSGPGVNTVGDPSVATDVVSVAASVSKDTWLANYGSVVKKENALFNFSSRGPREDGGFKPNLTAPGSAISTVNTWLNESSVPEAGYTLPIGYQMANGTSMASPQATGGAALLLSAAKATDRGITPAQLRRALYTSANKIKDVSVAAQGNGLMDVNGAWSLLARKVEARTYTSSAPVCTPFSDGFATPGQGVGIHNRCAAGKGGLKAGQFKTYNLKLTRTSGAKAAVLHRLSVVGDKRAFHVQPLVLLPLDKTVTVPVLVTPGPGLNSAIIEVDDPLTSVTDFEVLNTVVTGAEPAKPAYEIDAEATVDRNSSTSYFITVPEGATALQVDLSGIATGSQTRWIAINPWGVPVESTSSLACYSNFSDAAACKPQERAYENPMPGVWELEVESRRTSPMLHNPYELIAKVQGVTVNPATVELPSVTAGTATPVTWSVKNNFGPLNLTATGGALGSALTERPTIADGTGQEYTVEVPAGAQRLDVAIGNVSDAAADLDLSVYLGTTRVGQSADGDSEESVSIPNPAAGTYTVKIDGYAVPSGSTQYDYRDVFLSPALGAMTVPTTVLTLANGATGPVTGTVTAATVPVAGRSLFGEMTLLTDEGAIVGRGTVSIGKVG
ncbi:serine protease [Amorphoplanes digitatis]|uniref:Subtilisin family serine protease n=1 Tax=Actinoplanes digitatis TaxID=1868 RepID=A0A7W7I5Y3_9ACTN|nr:subtilisin family serine protease [Actinoplanes digitatis]GID95554.1 serine protease [Actinoplanes digitatis]